MMPNPKSGTVSDDLTSAIKDIKLGGRVEYKMDKTANIGVIIGKRSHSEGDLVENLKTVIDVIGKAKPEGIKGKYIKNMAISATMSPSVTLDPAIYSNF
jgi:large subunit ribosomal protein L1